MKARLVTFLLVLSIGFSMQPVTASAAGTISESSQERRELEQFLTQFTMWGIDYDSQSAATDSTAEYGAKNILEAMLAEGPCYCYNDSLYPGEAREVNWTAKDPLGKWAAHMKTNAAKVDWILKNIFNCSESDIAYLKSSVLSRNENFYYLNGYYYTCIGGIGDNGCCASITELQASGGKYRVAYNLWNSFTETNQPCYAVVELKNIDGKNYWSLYYNTELKNGQNPAKTGGFLDVSQDAYYCASVIWAVDNGITAGTGLTTFSPDADCTKGQILTFLWRADGEPEPVSASPFYDIGTGDYYYKAALWASERGLVSGTAFNADEPCTRAMTVTYLWKLSGSPSYPAGSFSDVPANADCAQAVAWAVRQGVTSGTGGNQFSPGAVCTRGQIVTFLYRYFVEALPNTPGETNTGWSEVYKDFVLNKKFLTVYYPYEYNGSEPWGSEDENGISLYDMDADGVPELFITNGSTGQITMHRYAYTYVDGNIEYIGNVPNGFCFYTPGSQFSGLWGSSGFDGTFYTSYYYKEGNQVRHELVLANDGLGSNVVQETSNNALFNASDITKMPWLQTNSVDDIRKMGWNQFISGN